MVEERAPMATARLGFGAVVDNYGENIYIAGGICPKMKALTDCDVYSVTEDNWSSLKPLNEARFSQSLAIFNDVWLFQFGGFGEVLGAAAFWEQTPKQDGQDDV